ncbi:hypothetical protein MGWOODY_Mmi1535 [hydrothermal vent metagenome]|uniref:Uncharacterized protein n=1 Tax=hydrothermal vent metagenome TaxID=652676 RepID=A0A160VGI0_9ZZZZ
MEHIAPFIPFEVGVGCIDVNTVQVGIKLRFKSKLFKSFE